VNNLSFHRPFSQRRSGIMLAYPFEEKRLAKWAPPYLVQPKLDGERCRAVLRNGSVTLFSSEENEILSVPHITRTLETSLNGLPDMELDGELYSHGLNLQEIHSIVSRKVDLHPNFESMNYHIFDLVQDGPTVQRITKLYALPPIEFVYKVPFQICHNFDQVMAQLEWSMSEGFEGIIVRHIEAPYIRRRSIYMMKFKPRREDVYEIIGSVEEISQDGVPKNSLGALICRSPESPTELFNVGTGFTRDDRLRLWESRESLPGNFVRVKYQHLTSLRGVPRSAVYAELVTND
jgi:ATP-dependent DNA ligase